MWLKNLVLTQFLSKIQFSHVRDFRAPVSNPAKIKSMIFGGFTKSLYAQHKFDSDPERRFSVVLENDKAVVKWIKPSKGDLRIHYSHETDGYEPDFVAETAAGMFLCEPKRSSEMTDKVVLAKTNRRTLRLGCRLGLLWSCWRAILLGHICSETPDRPCYRRGDS